MSLKEELLKAKLISKKQLKQVEHEQRIERKQLGKEGLQEKEKARQQEIEKKIEEQKKENQALAQKQKEERSEKEKSARIEEIIQLGKLDDTYHGTKKFYFIAQDGKIPWLMVNDRTAERLERGSYAIIEYPPREFVLVHKSCADKLYSLEQNIVRFYERHF